MFGRIEGVVVEGNRIGRRLGFPTANIRLSERNEIKNGVYVVTINYKEFCYKGVANIGDKPTLNGDAERMLEVNIFDFDKNMYGEHISVELLYFIRNEVKFDSLEELRLQIDKDRMFAEEFFEKNNYL